MLVYMYDAYTGDERRPSRRRQPHYVCVCVCCVWLTCLQNSWSWWVYVSCVRTAVRWCLCVCARLQYHQPKRHNLSGVDVKTRSGAVDTKFSVVSLLASVYVAVPCMCCVAPRWKTSHKHTRNHNAPEMTLVALFIRNKHFDHNSIHVMTHSHRMTSIIYHSNFSTFFFSLQNFYRGIAMSTIRIPQNDKRFLWGCHKIRWLLTISKKNHSKPQLELRVYT